MVTDFVAALCNLFYQSGMLFCNPAQYKKSGFLPVLTQDFKKDTGILLYPAFKFQPVSGFDLRRIVADVPILYINAE